MKRGLLIAVALVVVAVAASAFFLLAPSGPREIKLEMREFGFNAPSGGPTIRAKVGETIRIVLVNVGGADHEFMVVSDKDGFLKQLHQVIEELRAKGLDEEKIETSEEVEEVHHHFTAVELMVGNDRKMDVELEPRESATITLRFDRPGTYYYLCADMGLTFPEIHADRGMWGTIVVEG
ncbi:MAG: hypothetical protein QXP81_08960 [Nitrososphaerota archaeon]